MSSLQVSRMICCLILTFTVFVGCAGKGCRQEAKSSSEKKTTDSKHDLKSKVDQAALSEFRLEKYRLAESPDAVTKNVFDGLETLKQDPGFYFVVLKETDAEKTDILEMTYAKTFSVTIEEVEGNDAKDRVAYFTFKSTRGEETAPAIYELSQRIAEKNEPIQDLTQLISILTEDQRTVVLSGAGEETSTHLSVMLGFFEGVSEVRIVEKKAKDPEAEITFLGPVYRVHLSQSGENWIIEKIEPVNNAKP